MMHVSSVLVALAAASIATAGCKHKDKGDDAPAGAGAAGEPSPEGVAKGKQAIGAMKRQLLAALTEALKSGAPSALSVCSGVAPGIAQSVSGGGVTVGRATRKPRNPANAAAGWRTDALARFESVVAAGQPLEGASWASLLPGGTTVYAEPLVIQQVCVACHGAALAPEVTAALAARYPADQATGYAVGDLRGVAWAEIVPSPPR